MENWTELSTDAYCGVTDSADQVACYKQKAVKLRISEDEKKT